MAAKRTPDEDTQTIQALEQRVKQLERELLLGASPTFRFEIGLDARITSADETTARILGRSVDKTIGYELAEKDICNIDKARAFIDHFVKGAPYPNARKRLSYFHLGHPQRFFHLSFRPKKNGRGTIRGFAVCGKEGTLERYKNEMDGWIKGRYAMYDALNGAHIAYLQATNLHAGNTFSAKTIIGGLTNWMAERLGYTVQEVPGSIRKNKPELDQQPMSRLLPAGTIRALNAYLKRGEEHWIQGEIIAHDGSCRPARFSITRRSTTWMPGASFCLIIVDRSEDEAVLSVLGSRIVESEEKFRNLFETAHDPILVVDGDGTIQDCNQSSCTFFGHSYDTIVGRTVSSLLPKRVWPAPKTSGTRNGHGSQEVRIPLHNGSVADAVVSHSRIQVDGSTLFQVVIHDITRRKSQERQLEYLLDTQQMVAKIAERFATLSPTQIVHDVNDAVRDLGMFLHADRAFIFRANRRLGVITNTREWCARGVERRKKTMQSVQPDTVPWLIRELEQGKPVNIARLDDLPTEAAADRKFLKRYQARSFLAVPMLDQDFTFLGFLGVSTVRQDRVWGPDDVALVEKIVQTIKDALDRADIAHKLQLSETNNRFVVENLDAAVFVISRDEIRFVSPRVETILGYTPEQLMNTAFSDLIIPADRTTFDKRRRVQEAHEAPSAPFKLQARHAKGHEITIEFTLSAALLGTDWTTQVVVRNETEVDRLQLQLQRTARLASLGTLAAGVAHEINNPLAVISMDLLRIVKHAKTGPFVRETCSKLMRMATRIAEITGGLLTFAKVSHGTHGKHPVSRPLTGALELVQTRFDYEQKRLVIRIPAKLPTLICDSSQLEQVFVNVCINALEAMATGGTLTVSAKTNRRSDTVTLQFTDTGEGMTAEEIERAFDPFFTTKETGTGLGLAISYSIIRDHGGDILITSEPDTGTTVSVVLPTVKKQRPVTRRAGLKRKAPKQRTYP